MKLNNALNINSNVYHDNYSVQLDGAEEYIDVDTAVGDISVSKGTMSAWARISGATSINGVVFKASVDSNNNINILYNNGAAEWRFIYKAGGTAKTAAVATTAEADGLWYHLAITWDTDASELKGYVNGSQVGGTQTSLGTWAGELSKCYFGANTLAANSYFKGNINEMSIFTQVKSISLLYNSGHPVDVSGMGNLVGYWKYEEGTGTSAYDSSGKGNTGTLVNTPTWSTNTKL